MGKGDFPLQRTDVTKNGGLIASIMCMSVPCACFVHAVCALIHDGVRLYGSTYIAESWYDIIMLYCPACRRQLSLYVPYVKLILTALSQSVASSVASVR
jgi:hypothetical protein